MVGPRLLWNQPSLFFGLCVGGSVLLLLGVASAMGMEPPAGDIRREVHRANAQCSGGVSGVVLIAETQRTSPSKADLGRVLGRPSASRSTTGGGGGGGACSAADFATATGSAFVELVATADFACLNDLWDFDSSVAQSIDGAKVQLVGAAIQSESIALLANAARLERFTLYYQIAFFHEFFESSVTYDSITLSAAQSAMVTLGQQPDLITPSPPEDLLGQWLITIDSTNSTHLVVAQVEAVLARYVADPIHESDFFERVLAYRCLFTLARQIGNSALGDPATSPWYSLVSPSLLATVQSIALDLTYDSDSEYVVLNALWVISRFSLLDLPTRIGAHTALTQAYLDHVPYTGPWLRAVTDLEDQFAGELSNGATLDLVQIRANVMALALPHTYEFDQGALTFRTAIDLATATALFDALQEVESQFFRKCNALEPVPGDENEAVTLVVYESPDAYATFQPFLYGLPTNNGGIFIESGGTLYTYDRTPAQSIYTLEELLRHEFTHYLESRFLIAGSFGEPGTLYDDNRLVWVNEGLAEYLVGATRTNGVLPRGALLSQIDADASRLTISDILSANYNQGFTFYRYAGSFFEFLEEERPESFVQLFQAVRGNDVMVLDALYAALSSDPILQNQYDAFLDASVATLQSGTGLFAEDVPTVFTPDPLPTDNASEIRSRLEAIPSISATGQFWVGAGRYVYEYEVTTPLNGDPYDVYREATDAQLDSFLGQLPAAPPSSSTPNFTSTVAWFGEVEVVSDTATATVVFEGPYEATASDTVAPAVPSGVTAEGGSGSATVRWQSGLEADLNGYRIHRSSTSGGPYELVNAIPFRGFEFRDEGLAAGTFYYVVTALDASGNESMPSAEVNTQSSIDVLVVNGYFDDGNTSYFAAYIDALTELGVGFATYDPFVEGDVTSSVLAPYVDGVVIWAVGYNHGGFPNQLGISRRDVIVDYLDDGGSLVMSGAFVASLDNTPLFNDYFLVDGNQFSMGFTGLLGNSGHPVGDGVDLDLVNGIYQTELTPVAPATSAFQFDSTSWDGTGSGTLQAGGSAVVTVDLGYRVAFYAFPFADLVAGSEVELLAATLDWMLPCSEPFLRGDANDSSSVDVADAVAILGHLFGAGPAATPTEAGDANGDDSLDVSDPIYLLGFLFAAGPPPPAPFPEPGCP